MKASRSWSFSPRLNLQQKISIFFFMPIPFFPPFHHFSLCSLPTINSSTASCGPTDLVLDAEKEDRSFLRIYYLSLPHANAQSLLPLPPSNCSPSFFLCPDRVLIISFLESRKERVLRGTPLWTPPSQKRDRSEFFPNITGPQVPSPQPSCLVLLAHPSYPKSNINQREPHPSPPFLPLLPV